MIEPSIRPDASSPDPGPEATSEEGVRPDPAVFERNWAALARHPGTLRMLEQVEPYPIADVESSKSGPPIPVLADPSGVRRPLHSRHRPREEAQRTIDHEGEIDGLAVVAFLGAGFGYAPVELVGRIGPENMLVWIESDARVFRTALEWVDLRPVIEYPGTRLWIGCSPSEVNERMRLEITRILTGSLLVIRHPASIQRDPEQFQNYRTAIENFAREGAVNVRTTFYLSRVSAKNQAGNMGAYVGSPGIEFLRGALVGKPALLISAGPSLRKGLGLLAKLEGRVTTLAVSTALRPVVESGVRPDFTALIDYHRMSKRYFEGIDPSLDIPLVCDLKATDAAVRAHSGPVLFSNDLIMNTMFEGIFGDRGQAAQGATVAHIAFRFLAHLGADPIILLGQDLSYPGGLIHVPGTAIQAQEFPSSHRFYSLEMRELEYYFSSRRQFRRVPASSGGEVPTDEVFFTYLQQFERMFAEHPGTVLNATEGGAHLRGAENVTLEEIVSRFGDGRAVDFRAKIREQGELQSRRELATRALEVLDRRRDELRALQTIYDRILKLLSRIIRINESGEPADEIVLKVQALHREAGQYKLIYLYLSHLAQSDGWERIRADRRLDAGDAQGVDKQLHQSRRDREYIRGLREACEFARDCFAGAESSIRLLLNTAVGLTEPDPAQ